MAEGHSGVLALLNLVFSDRLVGDDVLHGRNITTLLHAHELRNVFVFGKHAGHLSLDDDVDHSTVVHGVVEPRDTSAVVPGSDLGG